MVDISSFEKKYVSDVKLEYDDTIVITAENIEHLRKCLTNSKFKWLSGHDILDPKTPFDNKPAFDINRILFLDETGTWAREFDDINNVRERALKAINYVFIDI